MLPSTGPIPIKTAIDHQPAGAEIITGADEAGAAAAEVLDVAVLQVGGEKEPIVPGTPTLLASGTIRGNPYR